MKTVLITAGPVYGSLDDNKLVTNRSRGLWALRFADYLNGLNDPGHTGYSLGKYRVIVLVPDILSPQQGDADLDLFKMQGIQVIRHHGYQNYRAKCQEFAPQVDCAVMAAAVVNWIPAEPFKGKMPTHGYEAGDVISIPFVLAPRVIEDMKKLNPKLTLIGCKMLSGSSYVDLIESAYSGVLLPSRCNVVVANDLQGLKAKHLVYQDRTVQTFENDFRGFYETLVAVIEDEHYQTVQTCGGQSVGLGGIFEAVVEKYRDRFTQRSAGSDRVFGSVYVPYGGGTGAASPREKGSMFSQRDAVLVEKVEGRTVYIDGPGKATLNAPLLVRVSQRFPEAKAVLHLHEQLPDTITVPYAPPGTVRDNDREIPGPVFNIEGHGFIACLDENLELPQEV